LISTKGKALIGDFGVAKLLQLEDGGSLALRGRYFTPGYGAPELRITGVSVTKSSDIYALGCTMLSMVLKIEPSPSYPPASDPALISVDVHFREVMKGCWRLAPSKRPLIQTVLLYV
jgi:serine/threonine protein kinase